MYISIYAHMTYIYQCILGECICKYTHTKMRRNLSVMHQHVDKHTGLYVYNDIQAYRNDIQACMLVDKHTGLYVYLSTLYVYLSSIAYRLQ
jgi:hypothetical protein